MTPEQRAAALAKAAEARAARAEIKARLKNNSMTLAEALASDDPNVGKLKVVSLLESLPGCGQGQGPQGDGGHRHRRQPPRAGPRRAAARRRCSKPAASGSDPPAPGRSPLIIVVSGPGGVGKGTIVDALVGRDPRLWLSRSWTTRAQRPGEPDDGVRVHRPRRVRAAHRRRRVPRVDRVPRQLLRHADARAAEPGADVVLEIEVDGAQQVKALRPDALLIFVLPPSARSRSAACAAAATAPDKVVARLRKAEDEEPIGRALADHVVVNDDLADTVDEMLDDHRPSADADLITA